MNEVKLDTWDEKELNLIVSQVKAAKGDQNQLLAINCALTQYCSFKTQEKQRLILERFRKMSAEIDYDKDDSCAMRFNRG